MVVDNYNIDNNWEKIKYLVNKLIVVDDINRDHSADYLINPNWYFNKNYKYLIRYKNCNKILFGPNYSLSETVKKSINTAKFYNFFWWFG